MALKERDGVSRLEPNVELEEGRKGEVVRVNAESLHCILGPICQPQSIGPLPLPSISFLIDH